MIKKDVAYNQPNLYLLPQEHSLALLRQAVLSHAHDVQLEIVAIQIPYPLCKKNLSKILNQQNYQLSLIKLRPNDVIIFEISLHCFDNAVWTGITQYKRAVENKLKISFPQESPIINVIPMASAT